MSHTWSVRRNRYAPAPDGQRFLIITTAAQEGASIQVVLNWMTGLKR